ncbi:MAG: hypothetical protein ABIF18_04135, partial [archaeon]
MEILFLSLKYFVISALLLFFGVVVVFVVYLFLKIKKEGSSVSKILQGKYFKLKFGLVKIKNDNKVASYFCKIKSGKKNIAPLTNQQGLVTTQSLLPARGDREVIKYQCAIRNRLGIKFKIFFNEFYLKILSTLITLFNKPKESFEILKEELERKHGKDIFIKIKNEKISLNELNEKLKNDELKNKDQIIQRLIEKLFQLHKQKQRKLKIASSAMMVAMVVATVITSLVMTTIFPNVFQSHAATYTFVQTDWSGGATANNATHSSDQSGWDEYSAKDSTTTAGTELTMAQGNYTATDDGTFSTTGSASGGDFDLGTASDVEVVGSGTGATVQLLTEVEEDTIAANDFVCTIRSTIGTGAGEGDYDKLSTWEAAINSDLTAATSEVFVVSDIGTYVAGTDDGDSVTFTGGGTGILVHIN